MFYVQTYSIIYNSLCLIVRTQLRRCQLTGKYLLFVFVCLSFFFSTFMFFDYVSSSVHWVNIYLYEWAGCYGCISNFETLNCFLPLQSDYCTVHKPQHTTLYETRRSCYKHLYTTHIILLNFPSFKIPLNIPCSNYYDQFDLIWFRRALFPMEFILMMPIYSVHKATKHKVDNSTAEVRQPVVNQCFSILCCLYNQQ